MASIYNRGTRAIPKFYAQLKHLDGKWKMYRVHCNTGPEARAMAETAQGRIDRGLPPFEEPKVAELCSDLIEKWLTGLTNRNADDDRSRARRHLIPVFGRRPVDDVKTIDVLRWITAMREGTAATTKATKKKGGARLTKKLAEGSMRANLNLLSRFFGWCVEEEHVAINPVRQVPTGRRPHPVAKADQAWIEDDAVVRKVISALPQPVNLMFYLGNRSGLRVGEICGLRMSDLGFLTDGVIRVRYSYDGPLKEDKRREGKSKFVPAPADAEAFLADWLTARRHAGAEPEDLVFPVPERFMKNGKPWPRSDTAQARKQIIEDAWSAARKALELKLTFYQATRHSFVSRNLSRGASLDEVSAAVGHSSPVVTRRYYDHFVRDTFSPTLRAGLGLSGNGDEAKVIELGNSKPASAA
jgi:integrase